MNASVQEWHGDFKTFLYQAQTREAPVWTLPYEERRQASGETRVVKQTALESSWTAIPTHGVWKRLRAFALPHCDFRLTRSQFCAFLTSIGITSPSYHDRIWMVFSDPFVRNAADQLNGLCFTKTIDIGLSDETTCNHILQHCFSALPLTPSDQPTGAQSAERVLLVTNLTKAIEQSKGNKPPPTTTVAPDLLIKLNAYLGDQNLGTLSFTDFASTFMSSADPNFGELFTKQIIEACAKYFREPFGTLPRIPQRWLEDIAPVTFNPAIPADADALLLQDVERLGQESGPKTGKTKKKQKSAAKKKSSP